MKKNTKAIRKIQPRRWEKAIAPNHNNHSHNSNGSVKLIGWGA